MTVDSASAGSPRAYPDGHPLDQIHYREYKLILGPRRFTTAQSVADFTRLVRRTVDRLEVGLDEDRADPEIREVLFFDTPARHLYLNAGKFILRQRTEYRRGWPVDEREVVLKFRHADPDVAAAVDMRATRRGGHVVKFKEELLPLREQLGGLRSLFSHNCVLGQPPAVRGRRFGDVAEVFPVLRQLDVPPETPLELVNDLATEEIMADVGDLHFGHGLRAKATIAVWRDRGPQTPLVGEFSFQCKFERYEELSHKARKRSDEFFRALQLAARDWVQLDATKTGVVYGYRGAAVVNRE